MLASCAGDVMPCWSFWGGRNQVCLFIKAVLHAEQGRVMLEAPVMLVRQLPGSPKHSQPLPYQAGRQSTCKPQCLALDSVQDDSVAGSFSLLFDSLPRFLFSLRTFEIFH